MTAFRGISDNKLLEDWLHEDIFPAEDSLTEMDAYYGAMAASLEMLKTGTTCFSDMYFHMDGVAAAVEESGIRATLAYGMIDVGKDENEAEAELEEGYRFMEEYDGAAGGRISTRLGPHSPETCSSLMYPSDSEIMTHLSETEEGVADVVDREAELPVLFLQRQKVLENALLAHGVHMHVEEIEMLGRCSATVSHCPSSNLKLGSGVAPIPALLEAGVNVSLGTDGAASNNTLDMFRETRLAALLHKGVEQDPALVPAEEALRMATLNGAEALGINAGALEPGRRGDLVAVELSEPHSRPVWDPVSALVYASGSSDVRDVYVDGERVVKNGELVTMDLDHVVETAEQHAEQLLN